MHSSGHIPETPKSGPPGIGDGSRGAVLFWMREKIRTSDAAAFSAGAALVIVGWAVIGVLFSGCITPRRHQKDVGTAYRMGRADAAKDCEAKLQELRRQIEEKNDRLRKFNQIYEDGRLRGGHVDPAGK